jgi:anti-sigma B factor antagonist
VRGALAQLRWNGPRLIGAVLNISAGMLRIGVWFHALRFASALKKGIMIFKVNAREVNGVTVLDLSGRFANGHEGPAVSQTIKQLVSENKSRILVNLAGVNYIDSYGVGELVAGFSSTKKGGGMLKISSPTGMVREVLRLVRLPTIVDVFDNEAAALASFA